MMKHSDNENLSGNGFIFCRGPHHGLRDHRGHRGHRGHRAIALHAFRGHQHEKSILLKMIEFQSTTRDKSSEKESSSSNRPPSFLQFELLPTQLFAIGIDILQPQRE
jgi:hypothetical protein